ncbi:hypothetical protein NDU88_009646 [Pleurodeles waltl]|uniref:Uncharacterized protein n=1 Tax=Pleurodeles waltl TaxID=8319 RepID=A0AAV7PZL9_PLEWA|nr:hypothetical protein NDU88_009646 [Pleurodeles waltl]
MVKRKAKGSPNMALVQPELQRLHKPSKAPNNCVTNEIDNLIEEVESIIKQKEMKFPQKRPKSGPLDTFFFPSCSSKGNCSSKEVISLASGSQLDGPDAILTEQTLDQLVPDDTTPDTATVHNIPCSNPFLPLASQSSDSGSPLLNFQASDCLSSVVSSQKELISVVLGLQEEVRDLKKALAEVLSFLRVISPTGALVSAQNKAWTSTTAPSLLLPNSTMNAAGPSDWPWPPHDAKKKKNRKTTLKKTVRGEERSQRALPGMPLGIRLMPHRGTPQKNTPRPSRGHRKWKSDQPLTENEERGGK